MLKLYICPKCKTVRFVSKKNTTCYNCNIKMKLANITYSDYIQLDAEARRKCIDQFCQNKSALS